MLTKILPQSMFCLIPFLEMCAKCDLSMHVQLLLVIPSVAIVQVEQVLASLSQLMLQVSHSMDNNLHSTKKKRSNE